MRTLPALVAAAALGVGAVTIMIQSAEATATHPSTLKWGACPTDAPAPQQCARLKVPLDYKDPEGRAIAIEVSRIPAADPKKRKGVLMLNGGGPGSSLDVPTAMGSLLPKAVRDSYDLVAFDPRGIGHSTPMNCGRHADELVRDEQLEVLSFPGADGSINANVAYAKRMAHQCAANSADLLPHLTTANVARDMDRIRSALGERSVSYYGISWGTYLGSIYRALFPENVDRVVLDSSVDPNKRGYDDFRTFSEGMEDRWPDLARFAVAHKDTVRLGSTPSDVRRNYLALAAKLDRRPVSLPGTKAPINGNLIRLFTWQLSYNDASMIATKESPVPMLARLWQAAAGVAAGNPSDADRTFLTGLTNDFVANGTMQGVPQDNLYSAGWAISCGDTAWPRNIRTYAHNTAVDRAKFPLTAGAPANITPCSAWVSQPTGPEPKVKPIGKRNVLILQNRRDPATPLSTARGMRQAMGGDAVLVDVDAGGHGVLVHPEPNACAIGALDAFFVSSDLPRGDMSCT
ncbi:alpha/beta hydrolase [Streptomyces mirabilis]|uniref:alpha/beta hydrolase n=1 Tax=Streptomyces mirabilis TaxID=68239 RepID=UPI002F90A9AD